MEKLKKILKTGLMIWGAVSLLFIIVFYITLAFQLSHRERQIAAKEDQDVRFVTECFGLDPAKPLKLEHSYHATGSWAGDYMKLFAVKRRCLSGEYRRLSN